MPTKRPRKYKTASALTGEVITKEETKAIAVKKALANPKFAAMVGKGRPKGSKNKTTKKVQELLQNCFNEIGGEKAFAAWARLNRDLFYKIWARMLATEARQVVKIHANQMAFVAHPSDKAL